MDFYYTMWHISSNIIKIGVKRNNQGRWNPWFILAPQIGLEPITLRLTAECSADWATEDYIHQSRTCIQDWCLIGMRRRSTLPGRLQPSTIDVLRLNFCVRDGNRWNPQAIATAKGEQNWMFVRTRRSAYCIRSVSLSPSSLPVALLCETSQSQFALGFAQAPHRVHALFDCRKGWTTFNEEWGMLVRLLRNRFISCAFHFLRLPISGGEFGWQCLYGGMIHRTPWSEFIQGLSPWWGFILAADCALTTVYEGVTHGNEIKSLLVLELV